MAVISNFPPELLSYLFSFVSGNDLGRVSQVCKKFQEAVYVESVWRKRCKLEYGVDTSRLSKEWCSSQEVYIQVLQRIGHLLGAWTLERECYGGLVQVQFNNGDIFGMEYLPPAAPSITSNLRSQVLFRTVKLKSNAVVFKGCRNFWHDNDEEQFHVCTALEDIPDKFSYQCTQPEDHCDIDSFSETAQNFHIWIHSAVVGAEDILGSQGPEHHLLYDLLNRKFRSVACQHFNIPTVMNRLKLPKPLKKVPMQPGLFEGTYGAHGLEIVMLQYSDDMTEALAKKITGDPNVPAGKISFQADLSRPMILNNNQQSSLQLLKDIDTADMPPGCEIDKLPDQSFILPSDCRPLESVVDMGIELPKMCKARFHAKGQIAMEGFVHHEWTRIHWIVFSQDVFAVLWIELKDVSIFARITDL